MSLDDLYMQPPAGRRGRSETPLGKWPTRDLPDRQPSGGRQALVMEWARTAPLITIPALAKAQRMNARNANRQFAILCAKGRLRVVGTATNERGGILKVYEVVQ